MRPCPASPAGSRPCLVCLHPAGSGTPFSGCQATAAPAAGALVLGCHFIPPHHPPSLCVSARYYFHLKVRNREAAGSRPCAFICSPRRRGQACSQALGAEAGAPGEGGDRQAGEERPPPRKAGRVLRLAQARPAILLVATPAARPSGQPAASEAPGWGSPPWQEGQVPALVPL